MTEEEWLAANDPRAMLQHLAGRAGDRKLRLFSCACFRRWWHLVTEQRLTEALALLERVIEGDATDRDRGRAYRLAETHGPILDVPQQCLAVELLKGAEKTLDRRRCNFGEGAAQAFAYATAGHSDNFSSAKRDERTRQADLVRDIFGNPFRHVTFDPDWRTTTALALATGIYEDRAFDRMPILADALQDAGCTSDDILNHLRDPHATHVRGCWALDLVLGKE
jgi:hypothetical protein